MEGFDVCKVQPGRDAKALQEDFAGLWCVKALDQRDDCRLACVVTYGTTCHTHDLAQGPNSRARGGIRAHEPTQRGHMAGGSASVKFALLSNRAASSSAGATERHNLHGNSRKL